MNTFTRIAAAALVGTCLAGTASAEAWTGPRVVGTGENASVVYPVPSENIVGSALTRTVGSGESATTEVISVQTTVPGRPTRVVRSGESEVLVPVDLTPATLLAQGAHQG